MTLADPYKYTALITSLPHQPALFTEKQTALSRIRLERRLSMLDDEDARLLERIEGAVGWEHLRFGESDAEIVRRARAVLDELPEGLVRAIVLWRLELRTVVAALRRRHAERPAPGPHEVWGHGRWVDHIRRYWNEPDLRLSGVFSWVGEANRLLAAGDTVGLERLLLTEVWQHLDRMAWEHEFDFEAVVVYVMRWSVVDRWSRYDGEGAVARFEELLSAGLGEHAGQLSELSP